MRSEDKQRLLLILQVIGDLHKMYNSSISATTQGLLQISQNQNSLQAAKDLLMSKNLTFTEGLDTLDIDLSELNAQYKICIGREEFTRYCRQQYNTMQMPIVSDFMIIEQDGSYYIYKQGIEVGSTVNYSNQIQYFIEFYRFASFVRNIADYVDSATNTIVIYTSNKGVLKLRLGEPDYNPTIDTKKLHESIDRLEHECSDIKKRDFLKNSIIDHAEHCDIRVVANILNRIDDLVDDSIRNFQIYLEEFSFDKFKTAWDKEKEKYFDRFRDFITKITIQMANLPISLIAFVITANDKLTNPVIEKAFYAIFSIYVFAALWVQIHNLVELFQIKSRLTNDSKGISNSYPTTYLQIKQDCEELKRKACSLIILSFIIMLGFAAISSFVIANCIKHI